MFRKNIICIIPIICLLIISCSGSDSSGGQNGNGQQNNGQNNQGGGGAAGGGGNAGAPCTKKYIECTINSCSLVADFERPDCNNDKLTLVTCTPNGDCILRSSGDLFDWDNCVDTEALMLDFIDHRVENDDLMLPANQTCGNEDLCRRAFLCVK